MILFTPRRSGRSALRGRPRRRAPCPRRSWTRPPAAWGRRRAGAVPRPSVDDTSPMPARLLLLKVADAPTKACSTPGFHVGSLVVVATLESSSWHARPAARLCA
ncbi:hypothetical protein ACRAWF_38400 [Streptomyces sp. L7]